MKEIIRCPSEGVPDVVFGPEYFFPDVSCSVVWDGRKGTRCTRKLFVRNPAYDEKRRNFSLGSRYDNPERSDSGSGSGQIRFRFREPFFVPESGRRTLFFYFFRKCQIVSGTSFFGYNSEVESNRNVSIVLVNALSVDSVCIRLLVFGGDLFHI